MARTRYTLKDGLCSIHDCKPAACALFPLGRVVIMKPTLEGEADGSNYKVELEVKYMLNSSDCGSGKQVHTVREWLARFGIPEHDEFFLLWSKVTIMLQEMISKLEEKHASDVALNFFWNAIYVLPQQNWTIFSASRRRRTMCQRTVICPRQRRGGLHSFSRYWIRD